MAYLRTFTYTYLLSSLIVECVVHIGRIRILGPPIHHILLSGYVVDNKEMYNTEDDVNTDAGKTNDVQFTACNHLRYVVEKNDHLCCVVKIECGRDQGTAICVHSSDSVGNVFLTCAHVVQHVRHTKSFKISVVKILTFGREHNR